jgi:ribosomal 30S subunit maturation factor RimM
MTWTPERHEDYDALKGMTVYSSDDEKLGKIQEIFHPQEDMPTARGRHFFRIEPGLLEGLFSDIDEVYVPERLVQTVDPDEDRVVLEVPKGQLSEQDFSRPPETEGYRRS